MKRDLELIREILLAIESGDLMGSKRASPWFYGKDIVKVDYHLRLLKEQKYIEAEARISRNLDGTDYWKIERLTWKGHDFVDALKDENAWKHAKGIIENVSGWTVDLVVEIGKAYVKSQIQKLGIAI